MKLHTYIIPVGQPGGGDIYEYHVDPMFDSSSLVLVGYCFTTVRNMNVKVSEKIISVSLIQAFPDLIIKALDHMAQEHIEEQKKKKRMLDL